MRSILSISLPKEVVMEIKETAKKLGVNVSEYFLHLYQVQKEEMISEEELLRRIEKVRKAHAEGKTKVLKSLADFL